jgi:glucosyl-3-phosphoglycerate synthase
VALETAAVIPARDEASTLADTLRALRATPGLSHLIVVDDGSHDSTPDIALAYGAELVCASPRGKPAGKGHALRLGLIRARAHAPDAVLLLDADLGHSAALLATLIAALDEDNPASIAAFPPATKAGFGFVKRFARRAIARHTGYTPSEPLSGQRALLVPALDTLPGLAPGFGAEVGMTLDLLSAGIKPLEIPLALTHRPTGRNLPGFAHRARQGLDIVRALRGARIPW